MSTILSWLRRLIVDRRGQDLVEFALLVGFVAFAAAATLPDLTKDIGKTSKKISKFFDKNLNISFKVPKK